jgi:hypothetical protein
MENTGGDPKSGKTPATSSAPAKNPLALGLIIIGALAMALSAFLPFDEPVGFHRIQDNTLMQNGNGWILVALALGIAAAGYRVSQGQSTSWAFPFVLCVFGALLVIWMGNDKGLRTLYPVGADGTVDSSQPGVVAQLGIAIYVAGAGVAAAAIGSLMFRQSKPKTQAVGGDQH